MRPAARLVVGAALSIGGSALVIAGAQGPWARVTTPGERVEAPGTGAVVVGASTSDVRGSDVSGSTLALAILALLAAAAGLLVGPRGRLVLFAVALAASGLGLWLVIREGRTARIAREAAPDPRASVEAAWGRDAARAGEGVALAGSALALAAARRVPRFRLPESAP